MVKRSRASYSDDSMVAKKSKGQANKRNPVYRALRSMLERKYLDTQSGYIDFNTTNPIGSTYAISNIAEGNDYNNRQGRAITGLYVQLDFYAYMDALTANPTTAIPWTWHLVVDKQANGTLQGYNVLFDETIVTNSFASFKNLASNDDRFVILKTECGTVDLNGNGPFHKRYFIKIPQHCSQIRYPGTTAAVPNTNGIIFAISGAAASVLDGYFNIVTRLVFLDV